MAQQIIRTKIIVPRRRSDLLSRQRLVDLLHDMLDYRLTVVTAPPGYGKTSLLIDTAHQSELPFCWYALDALDDDTHRFLAYFVACIRQQFPELGQQSAELLNTSQLDLDQFTTALINEIYDAIPEYFVMVIDDYHLVHHNPEINQFISQFSQQVSENVHLMLLSRTFPNLPDLPLMMGRAQLGGLDFRELAFVNEEIQQLIQKVYRINISADDVKKLASQTEGWVTGLLLSAEQFIKTPQSQFAQRYGLGLYEYLAQQVLERQPADIQAFLLKTSIFDEFDADLCEAVLGEGPWRQLMSAVKKSNLFTVTVDTAWLRYHHLFRDFLQSKLTETEKESLQRRFAAVLLERAEYEKAYSLYQALDDTEALARLIDQHGLAMMRSGREVTLAEWLKDIPEALLEKYPFLLCLYGNVSMALNDMHQSQLYLVRAERVARHRGDNELLARALVWKAARLRLGGKYNASLTKANEALALAHQDKEVKAEAFGAKGLALYHKGQTTKSIEWLEQSLSLYQQLGKSENVAISHLGLGMAYHATGRYTVAARYYNLALNHWRLTDNVIRQSTLLNNLGFLEHERGNFLEAKKYLDEAIGYARKIKYVYLEAVSLISLGDLYYDLEAFEAAREVYNLAQHLARQVESGFLQFYLNLIEARLSSSIPHLDQAERLADQHGSDYEHGLVALARGKFALKRDDPTEAESHLRRAADIFERGGQAVLAAQSFLLLSIIEPRAAAKAADLTLQLDTWQPLVLAVREVKPVLPREWPLLTKLLHLIDEFEQSIPHLHRQLRQQSANFKKPPLSIKTLGRFQVITNKKSLGYDWKRTASRDMFLYLLEGRKLSKEELSAMLWPDSNPRQNRSRFKNTVFYLRSVLGSEVLMCDEHEQYYFNRAVDYEYDKEEFERLVEKEELEAAISLYKGPYLPALEAWWVQVERERLQQLFQDAVTQLAKHKLQNSDYQQALKYCRLILDQNLYYEEAYRLAMQAYYGLGDHAAIHRQFERCQQILANDLKVTVSPQTEALYQRLVH